MCLAPWQISLLYTPQLSQHTFNRATNRTIILKVWGRGLVAQSSLTLRDPTDCNPPGSSVPGIFQARILELLVISSFRASSWPKGQTSIFCISFTAGRFLTHWAIGEESEIQTVWVTHPKSFYFLSMLSVIHTDYIALICSQLHRFYPVFSTLLVSPSNECCRAWGHKESDMT